MRLILVLAGGFAGPREPAANARDHHLAVGRFIAGALTSDVNPQQLLGAAFQPLVSLLVAVIRRLGHGVGES